MSDSIAVITQCNLCRKRFAPPAHEIADQQQRTLNYLKQLAQHLIDNHPRQNAAAQLQSLEYMALLRLQHFRTQDEQIKTQLDYLRWSVHRATLPHSIPDANLGRQVQDLARHIATKLFSETPNDGDVLSNEQTAEILTRELYPVFEAMRNLYEEAGKYQPVQVVTPDGTPANSQNAGSTAH